MTFFSEDFGRSDFKTNPPRSRRFQKMLIVTMLSFSVLFAFAADLWPCKKIYFFPDFRGFRPFTTLTQISSEMRYGRGDSGEEDRSLAYMILLKLFYAVIPYRLLCLRVISVSATGVSLFFLYRLSVILFCRPIALIFILLLITSPIYLDSMRALSFHPLTHMVVVVACYFLVLSLNGKKVIVKIALLSWSCFLSLSLYVVGKIVIFLPIVFFAVYWKKDWSKFFLFLIFFVGSILILDSVLGDISFNFKDFIFKPARGEWFSGGGKYSWENLPNHLRDNFKVAIEYLTNQDRKIFRNNAHHSRLFNVVYTPFLFLGFFVCCGNRKRSNIFLILWFALFFIAPMASTAIPPRRILFSLDPLYLLIALGLWFVFKLAARISSAAAFRRGLTYFSLILISFTGLYDLHEFFFKVARPQHNYSFRQLEKVASFIREKGKEVDWIKYSPATLDLIWGNPYFAINPEELEIVLEDKIRPDYGNKLKARIKQALATGKSLLYLSVDPPDPDIRWTKKPLSDLLSVSRIGGTELHYLLLRRSDTISPNLLISEKVSFTSFPHPSYCTNEDLPEGDEDLRWDISPEGEGEPVWVRMDFGPANAKSVKFLAAHASHSAPEHFFKEAALFGSSDGKNWELVSRIAQPEIPSPGEWRTWVFNHPHSYRHYKLVVYSVHTEMPHNFLAIMNLAMSEGRSKPCWLE